MKKMIPDEVRAYLTQLAKKQGGKFPANHVAGVLKFGSGSAAEAHGSADMPVWGPLFRSVDPNSVAELRLTNLIKYLEDLQAK